MQLFYNILSALFLSRPNRFVVQCLVNGRKVNAYLPNPGRLWELLFPGTTIYLAELPAAPDRKLAYLAVAVERDGMPIMLHTHHTNSVAGHLIRHGRVPGLEGAEIVKQEHTIGGSRFDFLLRKDHADILLEVKSCTLVNNRLAMFPDAVSARATKHIEELARLSEEGYGAAVLFVVHWPRARWFMPEHHTDLAFSRALYKVRDRVMVRAVSVGWEKDLSLSVEEPKSTTKDKSFSRKARKVHQGEGQKHGSLNSASLQETGFVSEAHTFRDLPVPEDASSSMHFVLDSPLRPLRALRETGSVLDLKQAVPFACELTIPWDLVDRESHDRGCYIIVLRLPRDRTIEAGSLGKVRFRKGYYCYIGSAMKDLSRRIERHRRLTKKHHWHIDYLREHAEFHAAIPIRASADLECAVAGALGAIADWSIPNFGCSDCICTSHLFGMREDPVHQREFIAMLLHFRMGLLEQELEKRRTRRRGDHSTCS